MKMPFGRLIDFENVIVDVIRHAERLEVEIHRRAVEHAQHDAFAELRRQRARRA